MQKFIIKLSYIYYALFAFNTFAEINCTIDSIIPLNFGEITMISNEVNVTSSKITVSCRGGRGTYTLSFSTGNNSDTPQDRTLKDINGNKLFYNFYAHPNYTKILGDGSNGTYTISGEFVDSGVYDIIIYGMIMPQPFVIPGESSDKIIVTLTY